MLAAALVAGLGTAAKAEEAAGAMRIYRDPRSGVIGAPAPGAAEPEAAALQAEAADDLREEPVTVPAGGVKLNLRGRYRSSIQRQVGSGAQHPHECTGPVVAVDE
jgi:hypothetical protein